MSNRARPLQNLCVAKGAGLLAGLCAIAVFSASATALTLIDEDFQGGTPGDPPALLGNVQENGVTTIIETTDPGADPFGAGNQSMRLVDQDGTSTGYRATVPIGTLPATNVDLIIEMDMLYTDPIGVWTVTNLFIGDSVGPALPWFPNANAVQIFPALTTSGIASVGQPGGYYSQGAVGGGGNVITQDQPFHLKVVTDSATSTYNVFVDGVQLGWDFGGGTVFDVPTAGTDQINMLTFTSEGLGVSSMGDIFVDNLKVSVIPEPAAATALIVFGSCLAMHRRRRSVQ